MTLWNTLDEASLKKLRRKRQPEWLTPMLATLVHDAFSDPNWVFERKLDGVRCLVFRSGVSVRIVSRNNQSLNETFPELVAALQQTACTDFVVDGEIVAFDGRVTSFSKLQQRIGIQNARAARATGISVYLYLFDMLHVAGHETSRLPLRIRKTLLKRAIGFKTPIRFMAHRNERGREYLSQACRKGWEGLIAKDASAPYAHGRSRAWLKLKCVSRQELVIGGYTEPQGERHGFGALLVGYYRNGSLCFAGKVGTGYDDHTLKQLGKRLKHLERKHSPFDDARASRRVHFVRPKLVAEIGFTEWTRDGKLRHPRFLGLRTDKRPRSIHRERPE